MTPYNNLQQPDHRTGPTAGSGSQHQQLNAIDRTLREAMPKCPRCSSTDTRFSFYANRQLSQPRYICKGCHRHWTLYGALRDVPVGGRRRRNWSSNSPAVSLDQPPLMFTSPLLIEYAAGGDQMGGLNYGQVNYNSTSASMGGGGSALSAEGSGAATGSILFAPGLEQQQVPQTPQFPLLGGLEASPGSLYPFEGSHSGTGGPGYGAGEARILPVASTSGATTQLASATMEDDQQLNLAMQFMGMREQYRNNIAGGSGTDTTSSAWPWSDL